MKSVNIKHLADTLDGMMDEWCYYLNLKTGEIVEIQAEYMRIAEELDEDENISRYADWEQDCIREAILLFEQEDDYIELPDKYEIHEYCIIKDFCYSMPDERMRERFCNLISGRGAFRRFKDAIIRYCMEDEWYSFKHAELCKIAREWCDDNKIPYVVVL